MSSLYTIMVTAPFANTYNQIDSIQIDKDYRIKKGFTFESTLKVSNGRYFIENCDDAKYIGRWVPDIACRITKTEEFNDTGISENLSFDTESCDVNIRLITDTCTIADYPRSIAREVKLFTGAVLVCDCVLYTNIDANQLVRYRISDADREELIGKWVQLDSHIVIDYIDNQYSENIESAPDDIVETTVFAKKLASTNSNFMFKNNKSTSLSDVMNAQKNLIQSTPDKNGTRIISKEFAFTQDYDMSKSGGRPIKYYVVVKESTKKGEVTKNKYLIGEYNSYGTNAAKTVPAIPLSMNTTVKDVRMKYGDMDEYYVISSAARQKNWSVSYYKKTFKPTESTLISANAKKGITTTASRSDSTHNEDGSKKDGSSSSSSSEDSSEPFVDSSLDDAYGGGDYSTGVESLNLSGNGFNQLMKIYNLQWSNKSLMDVPLERMGFVHGLPFQFTRVADRRRGSTNQTDKYQSTDMYGMTYAREILSQLPIVVFNPGEPQFLTKLKSGFFGNYKSSTSVKDKWMPLLSAKANENTVEGAIQQILNEGGDYDYYTMDIKTEDYFNYVNMLCKMCARNMGLDNEYMIGSAKKNPIHMNWNNYNKDIDVNCSNDSLMSVLGMNQGVAFVFDPQSSITDSISNSTTESQVAGLLNNMSATARELGFVTGTVTEGGLKLGASESVDYDEIASSYKKGWTDGNIPILDSISHYVTNISNGLNVRFPEIWSDSNQTKSYSIDMHFIAPYAKPLCVWKHVLVPFWHIFALASPRSASAIVSYGSPFLIRAFSKGYFNVEMGIIESLSYKRFGDGDAISANGIPTQMDVTVDFKDMYHMLAMTPYNKGSMSLFFNNAGLIELIGTLSGINMNRLGLGERLSLYVYTKVESVRTLGSNFMQHVRDRVRGVADKFYFGM